MAQFYYGQIVRRGGGWSPMRVLGEQGNRVFAVYCGNDNYPLEYKSSEIVLVTDPVREFFRCPGWEDRLSKDDKLWLQRQHHGTAAPLPWLNNVTQKGNQMSKLYQTKEETPRFGTLLATNSAGKLVLEMKGTNEVLTFEKKEVEEVKPYTVRVKFAGGDRSGDRGYEFLSRKGDVEVGDLLFIKGYGDMARVEAVDTKSDRATVELAGRKVVTAPFGEPVTE